MAAASGEVSAPAAPPAPVAPAAWLEMAVAAASLEPLEMAVLEPLLAAVLVSGVTFAGVISPTQDVEALVCLAPVAPAVAPQERQTAPQERQTAPQERQTAPRMATRTGVRNAETPITCGATNFPA